MGMYLGENPVAITKISDDTYGWLGSDVKYAGKLYEWNGTLDDTTYSTWTPSTTSGTILASTSGVASFTIPDRTLKAYYVLTRWCMNFAYNSGTTMTCAPIKWSYAGIKSYYNYPSTNVDLILTQWESGEYTSYTNADVITNYALEYYNSSGILTVSSSTTYCPAYSNNGAVWSTSTSGNTITVSLNKPAISARCSTTYFTTDRAANVNTTNSTIKYRIDLFTGPKPSLKENSYKMITDMWNNNWDL